jgi:hypothetical protein
MIYCIGDFLCLFRVLVESGCREASGRWKVFEYFCLVESGVGSGFKSWLLGIKIDFTTSGFLFWAC